MISGIILAAGTSSRLGRPKQLLELDGRPLLQHAIDAAVESGLDEVVVVLGYKAKTIAKQLQLSSSTRTVVNPDFSEGQSTSLQVGLEALNPRSVAGVLLLGDQPRMPSSAIKRAVAAFTDSEAVILRAVWQGRPGHPVIIARSEWNRLRQLEGDKGARELIMSVPHEDLEMEEPAPKDVDTWDEFEKVRDG